MKRLSEGVWPTMITPFNEDTTVDYDGIGQIVEWYIKNNVTGIFSVCQSSEMFYLSLEERFNIAKFILEVVQKRVPVIASGHVSDDFDAQIEEIKLISSLDIEAFVLVSNRLAKPDESDKVWIENAEKILEMVPDVQFGIYECPHPNKRLVTPEILKWCVKTGRFLFLKDTSCNTENIKRKLEAVEGSDMRIFNANAATLLETMKLGASGYSGVMGNMHPDLYDWLIKNYNKYPEKAKSLFAFLGVSSAIEKRAYPIIAKYYLTLEGIDIGLFSRAVPKEEFIYSCRKEADLLYEMTNEYRAKIKKP